ncbi:MAG TPA: helix-turn-helix transcriptional regulator [Marmoricola sp.]
MSRAQVSYDDFARELGLNLLRAREAKGWSQERVAHAAGLSGYTYQKFEKGESRPGSPMNPRLTTLLALAQVLETTVEELLPVRRPDVAGY